MSLGGLIIELFLENGGAKMLDDVIAEAQGELGHAAPIPPEPKPVEKAGEMEAWGKKRDNDAATANFNLVEVRSQLSLAKQDLESVRRETKIFREAAEAQLAATQAKCEALEAERDRMRAALERADFVISCATRGAKIIEVPEYKSGIGMTIPTNVFEELVNFRAAIAETEAARAKPMEGSK